MQIEEEAVGIEVLLEPAMGVQEVARRRGVLRNTVRRLRLKGADRRYWDSAPRPEHITNALPALYANHRFAGSVAGNQISFSASQFGACAATSARCYRRFDDIDGARRCRHLTAMAKARPFADHTNGLPVRRP